MSTPELGRRLEAILFTSTEESVASLAEGLGVMQGEIISALEELAAEYRARGVHLITHNDSVKFATSPDLEETVRSFHRRERRESLSRAGLETLAIIIHKEPVTRSEIEEIRGVSSERTIRSLQVRGLIREAGRSETLGRPIRYATSIELLEHFGVEHRDHLPTPPPNPELFETAPSSESPPESP